MKKTLIYLLLLALLGAGVWFFLFRSNDNVFGNRDASFNIQDTTLIRKIFLADKTGTTITLEHTDSGWMVNNTYKALKPAVSQLLETLHGQTAAYPVPEKSHNVVVQSLASHGVKVEIINLAGDKIRTFYVGNEGPDFDGNYMLMEGAKRPFLVRLPGHMGFLRPRYSTNITEWRDRHVFEVPAADILEVSVEYPQKPTNSFVISRQGGTLSVSSPGTPAGSPVQQRRANAYLGFFGNVNCENFANGITGLDTILAGSPKFCAIDLKTKKGTEHVDIYPMPINTRSKNVLLHDDGTVTDEYDADHYYAITNGGRDTLLIQHLSFEKIFRRGHEFFSDSTAAAR